MNQELVALRRYGPVLVAFWGWALLALSVSKSPVGLVLVAVGAAGAVAQGRAFVVSAVVEGLALLGAIALAPTEELGGTALGAAFVVGARVLARLARPAA